MASDYRAIAENNVKRRGTDFDEIGKFFSEELYSDRSHFIFELLQNAEDALERRHQKYIDSKAPYKVQFNLYEDRLEFRHYGIEFNEEDVRSISDIFKGTKKGDLVQIGRFGIGFKSVYSITATPEIHSGDEDFIIKGYIKPEAKKPNNFIDQGETVFIFPFNHHAINPAETFQLISNKLKNIGARILLFLRRTTEIEWNIFPSGEKGYYIKEEHAVEPYSSLNKVEVIGGSEHEEEYENWLVFSSKIKNENANNLEVQIAFRKEKDTKTNKEKIIPSPHSPLVAFFPTEKDTRLGFYMQGPYRTTPARDNVPEYDEFNLELISETAELIALSLVIIREMGLLSISMLESLPIIIEDFPEKSMFHPIAKKVRDVLIKEELLPADDGTYVAAADAVLVRGAEILKIINNRNLRLLMKTESNLKWLSRDITSDRTKSLRGYLIHQLEIPEIDAESLARRVDHDFLTIQTDDWMIAFYIYLLDQPRLWGSSQYNSGLLRNKNIIRLEDNNHVVPFREDGSPNAFLPPEDETDYPIVRRTIAENPQALDFLRQLCLSEPDICDDVIEKILPKYNSDLADRISEEEHQKDIRKIIKALYSASDINKDRILSKAKDTQFLKAVNQNGENKYKIPEEVYNPTDELKIYFSGENDVWFLNEGNNDEIIRIMGIADKPKFKAIYDYPISEEKKQELRKNKNCTEEYSITNYELHGLENFLNKFILDNDNVGSLSAMLWKFLLYYADNHSYLTYFNVIYRWKYHGWKDTRFDPIWLERLKSNAWIVVDSLEEPQFPRNVFIEDISEKRYERRQVLFEFLGIKNKPKDEASELIKKMGFTEYSSEDIETMKKYPIEFKKLANKLKNRQDINRPNFPARPAMDPKRREEIVLENYNQATDIRYEHRNSSVRISRGEIEPEEYLRNLYTNDNHEMVCQICKEEMPFKKRNGEYYFESVEALKGIFIKEHKAKFLALCPVCAAMYKEFIKGDSDIMNELAKKIRESEKPEIEITLGDKETSIKFVGKHWIDLKTIFSNND